MTIQIKESKIPPRLELFSDAVFAIIITIMVLELHPPEGHELQDLYELWPIFFAYVVSFLNLIVNWQNHHHLLRTLNNPNGKIMLANGHLLFWASLIPFATAWLGQNLGEKTPTVIYALVFLLYGLAYFMLQKAILHKEGKNSLLAKAIGNDTKAKATLVAQVSAIAIAFFVPWVSLVILLILVLVWLYPDRRIEKLLE
jgi:uncharacterized membrane protein